MLFKLRSTCTRFCMYVSRQRTVLYCSFALCTRYPECMFSPTSNMCECLERTCYLTPMGVDITALSAVMGCFLLPTYCPAVGLQLSASSKGWVDHRLQIPVCFQWLLFIDYGRNTVQISCSRQLVSAKMFV